MGSRRPAGGALPGSGATRILIVCPVFPPEPVTSAATSADLAAELAARGHAVTVITACPSRPGGRIYPGYRRGYARRERTEQGVAVVRTWSVLPARSSAAARLAENLTFGACAASIALRMSADVIFQNNWPIFASGLMALAAKVRRRPLVTSIQDVHPEAAVHSGKLRVGALAVRALRAMDGLVARGSAAIVAPSPTFAEIYRTTRRVPPERIHIVPNWMDETRIAPAERDGPFRASLGIGAGAFVGLYAGNVGEAADVESLLEAAALLQDEPEFVLVVAGDGARRAACEALAARRGLTNVRFHYPWSAEETAAAHAAADVLLLPTRATTSMTSAPSKLIAYMLSGRAIVAAAAEGSEVERVIRQADCGMVTPPGHPDALASAIRTLRASPVERERCGLRARAYAERRFSRGVCVPQMVALVEAVGASRTPPCGPADGEENGDIGCAQ